MRILADFHTHSKNSRWFHGKNTIEEMVIAANELGLEEIAITDHGYNHLFRTDKRKIAEARKTVDEINKWSKTKVLLGIEADIIAEDGTIDVDNETLSYLDILIVGYHRMIKTDFASFWGRQEDSEQAKQKATNAFVNAINKYPVTIVSHLDSILTTDLYEIGRACSEKGVMVEINNRHCDWDEDQINDLLASDCMFVVSSDAHRREDVGNVNHAMNIVKKYQIPSEKVANLEFSHDEMSDDDKEMNVYFSIYKQKLREKEEEDRVREEKRKTEFSEQLSDEMEKALQDIAREKGLNYKSKKSEEESGGVSFGLENKLTVEEEDLIKQANEYIQNNSLNEFDAQNMKLENDEINLIDENLSENIEQNDVEKDKQQSDEVIFDDEPEKKSLTENEVVDILNTAKQTSAKPKKNVSFNTISIEEIDAGNKKQDVKSNNKPANKNDIAGLVKSALGENKDGVEQKSTTKVNSKQSEENKKRAKSKFNPLSVLDVEKISDDKK